MAGLLHNAATLMGFLHMGKSRRIRGFLYEQAGGIYRLVVGQQKGLGVIWLK